MTFCFPLDKLVQYPYNVPTWHLLLLLPQWCFTLLPHGQAIKHKETRIRLKHFLTNQWENLQDEFFLRAQVLLTNSSSTPFPQHDPLTHECLFHNLALGRAREYSWAAHILAPFSLTPTSFDTILALIALHLESNGYFPFFFKDYELDQDLKVFSYSFKLVF